MRTFITDNFLLTNDTARKLYFNHAQKLPIIDFHSHLIPQQIAENKQFENLTQAWLYGDHYKWRAMRANGINEHFITGKASDFEKFSAWAKTVPAALRNPLYHWTHLELKMYFGIDELLNEQSAEKIFNLTAEMLNSEDFRARRLLEKMNVDTVCTTDDPVDDLKYHKQVAAENCKFKMLPTWRPDKACAVNNTKAYNNYINTLSSIAGVEINSFNALFDALDVRINYFHHCGCRLADFGVDFLYCGDYSDKEIESVFQKVRSGKDLTTEEVFKFKSACLHRFALQVNRLQWVQQFHAGPIRDNNTRLLSALGPDTGFDSIGDFSQAVSLSKFLNKLDSTDQLAKTILYNINPADNEVFATMIGNFQDGSVPGKIQWGAAWWFLDQKDGITKQLNCLSNHSLLSRFVGMLTDSRSLLSYPRHNYFRRILCNLFGQDVENHELPDDMQLLGSTIENICFNNARNYFGFNK